MLRGVGRRLVHAGVLLALVAGTGCRMHSSAGPVPVEGTRADLSGLAGTWVGRYWSEATGRHGTVTFRLRSGADTAYGEVVMTFSRALRLYGEKVDDPALRREPTTTIDIVVVRIEGKKVRGTLAPYWDPDCDCRARTVFDGALTQNRIAGSFTSRREEDAAPVSGRWLADRQPE
jgi:hypothetical protein